MDGPWQTVGGAKKKEKKPQQSSASTPQDDRAAATDSTPSAFAALDASWRGRNGAAQQQQSQKPQGATPLANGTGGAHGADRLTDDGGSSEASLEQQQTPSKRKKPKPPRTKKPTPASAAAALNLDAVEKVIDAAQQRYAADERVQLDTVADHFVSVFRDAELPFNKLLAEQPLPKVAKTPADAVPADITQAMSAFLAAKDAAAVAAFTGTLVDAAFEGVPEAVGSSKAPPKANVGLLVSLALALRAKPAALLLDADRLAAGGRRYSAPGRLPLLLWLLSQAAQGSEAVAVAVWVRVLLPQVLGSSSAAALSPAAAPVGKGGSGASATQPQQPPQQPHQLSEASAAKAFQYLDGLLGSPAVKRDMHLGIVVREGEALMPLVPPESLVALLQAAHDRGRLLGDTASLARSHQGILRTIALSGVPDGGFDAAELLRLSLDAAAAAPATDDPLVLECAHLVVEALEAHDGAFAAWQTRHKGQLRGSSRVLGALQHSYPDALMPLLALPAKRAAFVELMRALRQRHQYALRTGKGWQGAAARAADEAAKVLGAKMSRDGSRSAMRSALLTITGGVGLSVAVRAATGSAPLEHPLIQMVASASAAMGLTGVLQQAAVQLRPYSQQAVDLTWPHLQPAVEAATPYVQQVSAAVQPVVQQVSDAASQASDYAVAAFRNVTAAWS